MNNEYEYSLKVKDVKEFIKYCEDNNYEVIEDYNQTRTLYKNGGKVMARITKNKFADRTVEILNFKDDNLNDNVLKVSRETLDLEVTDNNRAFIKSLLDILELNNIKVLKRNRKTYKKGKVKFEIDEYIDPKMNVVAIEGSQQEVDSVYAELNDIIENNIEEQ